MKARLTTTHEGKAYWIIFCPGCQDIHMISVPPWTCNGDTEKPTIRESIAVTEGDGRRCHSYVTDGKIQFLSDCSFHKLANQTLDLPDLPEWCLPSPRN